MEISSVPLLQSAKSIHETHVEVRQTLHKQGLSIVTAEYSHLIYFNMSVFCIIHFNVIRKIVFTSSDILWKYVVYVIMNLILNSSQYTIVDNQSMYEGQYRWNLGNNYIILWFISHLMPMYFWLMNIFVKISEG